MKELTFGLIKPTVASSHTQVQCQTTLLSIYRCLLG